MILSRDTPSCRGGVPAVRGANRAPSLGYFLIGKFSRPPGTEIPSWSRENDMSGFLDYGGGLCKYRSRTQEV